MQICRPVKVLETSSPAGWITPPPTLFPPDSPRSGFSARSADSHPSTSSVCNNYVHTFQKKVQFSKQQRQPAEATSAGGGELGLRQTRR